MLFLSNACGPKCVLPSSCLQQRQTLQLAAVCEHPPGQCRTAEIAMVLAWQWWPVQGIYVCAQDKHAGLLLSGSCEQRLEHPPRLDVLRMDGRACSSYSKTHSFVKKHAPGTLTTDSPMWRAIQNMLLHCPTRKHHWVNLDLLQPEFASTGKALTHRDTNCCDSNKTQTAKTIFLKPLNPAVRR